MRRTVWKGWSSFLIYLGNGVVECSLFVYNRGIETQGNCEGRMRDICRRRGELWKM